MPPPWKVVAAGAAAAADSAFGTPLRRLRLPRLDGRQDDAPAARGCEALLAPGLEVPARDGEDDGKHGRHEAEDDEQEEHA